MFQAINLTKSYQQKVVLSGLNLEVVPGEVFCLLGRDGAGKSTAVDLFLNLTRATSGNCKVGTFDVALQPIKTKTMLGYIPSSLPLYDQLTGMEHLQYFSTLAGFEELTHADTLRLYKELGIPERLVDDRAEDYSIDARQRFGLAIAVARDVKGLLLDEPTARMDAGTANEFTTLVRSYAEGGITGERVAVLMTTASPALAAEFGHRVGLLRQGKLTGVLNSGEMGPQELAERCAAHMQQ